MSGIVHFTQVQPLILPCVIGSNLIVILYFRWLSLDYHVFILSLDFLLVVASDSCNHIASNYSVGSLMNPVGSLVIDLSDSSCEEKLVHPHGNTIIFYQDKGVSEYQCTLHSLLHKVGDSSI